MLLRHRDNWCMPSPHHPMVAAYVPPPARQTLQPAPTMSSQALTTAAMPSLHSAGPDVPMHFSAQLLADLRNRLLHHSSAQHMAQVLRRMRHNMQHCEHRLWMAFRLHCVIRFLTAIQRISLPVRWYLTEWTCNLVSPQSRVPAVAQFLLRPSRERNPVHSLKRN